MNITEMREKHRVLIDFSFQVKELQKGYANRYLHIDLSNNTIQELSVTEEMKKLWVGGKGFDLWLMMKEINEKTKWDSPENPICFSSGPLGGTTSFPGAGKTIVTSLSPSTNIVIDSNVGGYFGPYFKFAGYDALVVVGKSKEEIIIVIDAASQSIRIETVAGESNDSHLLAEELTEMYANDELDKRNLAVVSAGSAAKYSKMGMLNFSFWDWRRGVTRFKQAGRGGIGMVFRDKGIRAIVARNRDIRPSWRIEDNKVSKLFRPSAIEQSSCSNEVKIIDEIIIKWNSDPEFVIEMMQDIQDNFKYINKTAIDRINKFTGTPKANLYHIATFYKSLSIEKKGETMIQVCTGTTCHVKGAAKIIDRFEKVLGIKSGETTKDKKYSLDAVACLGACSIAPVIKIGDDVIGNVQAKDVEKLLKGERNSAKNESPKTSCNCSETKRVQLSPSGLDKIAKKEQERLGKYSKMMMVCTGTACNSSGGLNIKEEFEKALNKHSLQDSCLVVGTGCNGFCAVGPICVIQPDGTFYQQIKSEDVEEIVSSHIIKGEVVTRLLHKQNDEITEKISDIKFFTKQLMIALRNKGLIDPENIEHYISRNGYQGLKKAVMEMSSEDIVRTVITSGIRGRGGGGFPAGIKWETAKKAGKDKNEIVYIVCNADEGDPGAYMDRSIIETDPHSVIEGMLIGALAVGAEEGFIYIRKEYPLAMMRLEKAIEQAREYGLLGKKILGSDFDFDIKIHRGAGAFVCGESSALMASMSGKAGEPRAKYVHNVEVGYREKPTVLNNVETWANIPVIIEKGADWFASIGTGDVKSNPWNGSSGTKVFSLVGDIVNSGLVEVPMGITLREIVEDIGGGIPNGRKFKAVQTGGPSGGCLPEKMLDMKIDFDSLTEAGSMMGSGGMIVMDDKTCMVDVARYFIDFLVDESCGKCTPCREGLYALNKILERICNGEGREEDLKTLEEMSETIKDTSLCQLGGSAPNPVLSTLNYFYDEYLEHIRDKKCRAGVCKNLIQYSIREDNCVGCTLCAKNCPVSAITGTAKELHIIDAEKCIKCGICFEVCKFNAVEVK